MIYATPPHLSVHSHVTEMSLVNVRRPLHIYIIVIYATDVDNLKHIKEESSDLDKPRFSHCVVK